MIIRKGHRLRKVEKELNRKRWRLCSNFYSYYLIDEDTQEETGKGLFYRGLRWLLK